MTASDRFDFIDSRIAGAIEELAAASRPDYINDVLKVTAAHRQRPRWTFLERLLPMDTAIRRPMGLRRVPLRPLVVLLLVILAAAAAAVYVGSRPRVPAPFGVADNGAVLYTSSGDLYIRDGLDTTGHVLIGGDEPVLAPAWSPDGQWFSYVRTTASGDAFMVARADGSGAHELARIPRTGNAQAAWRPDSQAIALIYDVRGVATLSIAFVDGSPTQKVKLGILIPSEVSWRPPDGSELLLRVMRPDNNERIDLATVRPDGSNLHLFGLPSKLLIGPDWDNTGATWAPDGSRIAYNQVVANPGGTNGATFRVHLINPDGTGDVAAPSPQDGLDIQENWPIFSPDGRSILVHRWTWNTESAKGEGWLAVMPADGSAPARDIGPTISGGEDTGLTKAWSPDGTQVLLRAENTQQVYAIDPETGGFDPIYWTAELPEWQRTVR
jgi:Tol biopolymer transport system component